MMTELETFTGPIRRMARNFPLEGVLWCSIQYTLYVRAAARVMAKLIQLIQHLIFCARTISYPLIKHRF